MIEGPPLKRSSALRQGRLGPLLLASLAVATALWAQSLVKQPQWTDALILFAAAAALLVLASRGLRVGGWESGAGAWGQGIGTAVASPGLGRAWRVLGLAVSERQRRAVGAGLLLAGIALNAYALSVFRRGANSAEPWLIYLPSVVLALLGLWLLGTGAREASIRRPAFWRRRELWLLAAIVLVDLFFRIYRLDVQPAGFWYDEAQLGLEAQRVLHGEVLPLYFDANGGNGALIIYLTAASIKLFGATIFAVRLIPVLTGILAVPALYVLAKQMFGTRTALVAALLLAICRWHANDSRLAIDAIFVPLFEVLVFYFIIRGMGTGRTMDFVWAGVAGALGLNTYPSFRLVPAIAACYIVYRLLAERRLPTKQVLSGFGALIIAGFVIASPFLQYWVQNPQIVNGRTEVVNIFAGKSREAGIQAALESTRQHLLMFNVAGDRNGRHNLPGEPMLDYVTGALFVVGVGYSIYRLRRPEYLLLLIWLAAMLSAGIFSLDFEAPQSFRTSGAIPAVVLLAALAPALLLRASDGLGRLVPRGVAIALVLLLGYGAYLNYDTYFNRQANTFGSWADWSTGQTLMAKEMNALGQDWQFYVTSIFYEYPTVRYLAPAFKDYRRVQPADYLPVRESGDRNVAIFLDPEKSSGIFAQAKRYYPNATFKEFRPPFGGPPVLLEALLRKEDIQSVQGLVGRYYPGDAWSGKPALERRDAAIAFNWDSPPPLAPPFSVEWSGTLYAASYGSYLLGIRSPGAVTVWLDETQILKASGEEQRVVLATGDHALRVRAVVPGADGRTELYWQPPGQGRATVPRLAFYAPPVSNNGLLGSYYRDAVWGGEPALQQIDPTIAIYFHVTPLPRPYSVEWKGKVEAPVEGDYAFGLESIDDSWLELDGKPVVEAHTGNQYEEGRVRLAAGWHDLRLRYVDKSGWSHANLYWTPPGKGREIIPAEHLLPPQGSYPAAGAAERAAPPVSAGGPAAPPVAPPPAAPAPAPITGNASFLLKVGGAGNGPGQLSQPRDLAVGADGSLYVADTGNSRVLRFDPNGRFRAQIGQPGTDPGQLSTPLAITIAANGDVLVLDEGTGFVSRFAPDGTFLQRFAGPDAHFYHPRGLAVGPDDTTYVADTGGARIVSFAADGHEIRELGGKGNQPGQLLGPVGVVVDVEGMLWVADVDNSRVQRLSPEGKYLGSFSIPQGGSVDGAHLALGTSGVYVTDPGGNRVLFYSFAGKLLAQWGSGGEGDGQFQHPMGIVVDGQGNVWVAERDNHRVQKFRPPG